MIVVEREREMRKQKPKRGRNKREMTKKDQPNHGGTKRASS